MKIYLITHAHTEQSPEIAVEKWTLSRRGIEQSLELANELFWTEVSQVIVSSEQKTYLTVAEIVAARALPIWIDSRFDELRRSGWTEDYSKQVATVFAEPARSVAGWEPVDHVQQRALHGLADLYKRFEGQTLVLVGHGLCLSILRWQALGGLERPDFYAWQRLSFASVASITLNPMTLLGDFVLNKDAVR